MSIGRFAAVKSGKTAVRVTVDGESATGEITVTAKPTPPKPVEPVPPGQYSPRSPHWSHIRMQITDFRQVAGEVAWNAGYFDVIMDGDLRAYRQANPKIKYYKYTLAQYQQATSSGDLYQGIDYLRMKGWYDDPARNTAGYNIEDAYVHTSLPKSPGTRKVMAGWQGLKDWMMNPADPGYRAYSVWRYNHVVFMDQAPEKGDGFFIDSFGTGKDWSNGKALGTVEFPSTAAGETALFTAWEEWLVLVRAAISTDGVNRRIYLNIAQEWNDWIRRFARAAGAVHLEFSNRAESRHHTLWARIDGLVADDVVAEMVATRGRRHYESWTAFSPGNEKSRAARGRLVELASYYMARPTDPAKIDLVTHNLVNIWGRPFSEEWTKATETDLGQPRENRRVYQSGTLAGLKTEWGRAWTYQVWGREYERALVLLHSPVEVDYYLYGEETAVTISLPSGHAWHMLYEDGTLGPAITQVTLRNAEAAILIKM